MEQVSSVMKVNAVTKLTRNERLELKRKEAQAKREEDKKQAEADQRLTPEELQAHIDQLNGLIRGLEAQRPKKRAVTHQNIRDLNNDDEGPVVSTTRTLVLSPAEEALAKSLNVQIHALEQRISYFKDLQDPSRVEARRKKAAQPKHQWLGASASSSLRADSNFMRRMGKR